MPATCRRRLTLTASGRLPTQRTGDTWQRSTGPVTTQAPVGRSVSSAVALGARSRHRGCPGSRSSQITAVDGDDGNDGGDGGGGGGELVVPSPAGKYARADTDAELFEKPGEIQQLRQIHAGQTDSQKVCGARRSGLQPVLK